MPISNAETFVEAAKLLFGESERVGSVFAENGKLIINTEHGQVGRVHSLSLDLDDMDKFIREYQKKPEIADEPYLAAVDVLEKLGASAEHIKGGFKRNKDGEVYLSQGTMGKDGPGNIRVYTKCHFEVDLKHLDFEKAAAMVEEDAIAKKVGDYLSHLRAVGEKPHKMYTSSAHRKVEVPLGPHYGTACDQLNVIKELAEAAAAKPDTLDIRHMLPGTPTDMHPEYGYVLNLDFKNNLNEARAFLEAVKPIDQKLKQLSIEHFETKLSDAQKNAGNIISKMLEELCRNAGAPSVYAERKKGSGLYCYRVQLKGLTDTRFTELEGKLSSVYTDTKKKGEPYKCYAVFTDVSRQEGARTVDVSFFRLPTTITQHAVSSEQVNEVADILGHITAMDKALKTPQQQAR